ncbi:molybdopterin cofactor-binding domain-containing protein [Elusimicrobiota bacterium]
MNIKFKLNKKTVSVEAEPGRKVIDILKELKINSVRKGCDEEGKCGNCSILLDGKLVNSCMLIAPQIDGRSITTVEGLSKGKELHPIQKAFIEAGIVQCGYCTPAQVLAVKSLVDRKKSPSKTEITDVLSGILCRCTGYKQVFNVFEILNKGKTAKDFTPEYWKDYKVVGKLTPKIDAEQLVRAEDSFVEDTVPDDALHLYMLRSPHPHAEITSINTKEAMKVPGVEFILTHKNSPKTYYTAAGQSYPEPSPYDRRVICSKMRFIGDRVAAVAADSLETAKKAAARIKVNYRILKPVFSVKEARKKDAPIIHDRDIRIDPLDIGGTPGKNNLASSNKGGIGDIKKGFKEAGVVIEKTYQTPHIQHTPLEARQCYSYMKNGRLHIHTSVQTPYHTRRIVSNILGLPENKVRVVKEKCGGGFGAKQDVSIEDVAATVTYLSGKPVFFRFTRKDEFIYSRTRSPLTIKVKAGATKKGRLTALLINIKSDTGAYGTHCLTVPMNACSKTLPLYSCPNMEYDVSSYYTNNIITGAYQGYGAPQANFAIQMTLAELSDKLGIDFIDFISKNIVKKGDRLEILKQLGEGTEGIAQKIASCGLSECIEKGKKQIKWNKPLKSNDPDILKGKGMAIIMQGSGLPGIDNTNATIKMLGDGTFMLFIGGADLGTGEDTVAVKIAAEELKVDQKDIAVTSADTDTTPFDKGSYASSGTFFTGSAAYKAAENMKKSMLQAAGKILNKKPSQLKLEYPGKIRCGSKVLSFKELALETQSGTGQGQLITSGAFTTDQAPIPYGAHFTEVSVNKLTGRVIVDKYFALQDCGIPINPDLAEGQVYGAVLKTIGHTFYEALQFDKNGKCLNPNFSDYPIPGIGDLPEDFNVTLLEVFDPLTPYVGKSISEIACNGASAAIGIAIFNAAGIWLRSWPFTPDKVLESLENP